MLRKKNLSDKNIHSTPRSHSHKIFVLRNTFYSVYQLQGSAAAEHPKSGAVCVCRRRRFLFYYTIFLKSDIFGNLAILANLEIPFLAILKTKTKGMAGSMRAAVADASHYRIIKSRFPELGPSLRQEFMINGHFFSGTPGRA